MRAAAAGIVRVTSRARPQHDRPGRGREAYSAHRAHSPDLLGLTEGTINNTTAVRTGCRNHQIWLARLLRFYQNSDTVQYQVSNNRVKWRDCT